MKFILEDADKLGGSVILENWGNRTLQITADIGNDLPSLSSTISFDEFLRAVKYLQEES